MDERKEKLNELRKNIFLTAYSGGIGHLASAYSLVEILYALYIENVLKHNPKLPNWEGRDRLILSKGHGSLAVYNVLSSCGYFPKDELWTFCQPGSRLGGEPNVLELPGIEATTGSLGHGLSIGVGMALALKRDNKNNKIYVILGDGECEEGSIWEAVMSASAYKLDNLIVILDNNHIQKMGLVKDIIGIDSWKSRFASFGWCIKETDGHNVNDLYETLMSKWEEGKPKVLIANTIKGKGISIMENKPGWHWKMPNKKELKVIMAELNITEEELKECKKHI
ncbi:MAG: transketolase [Malacoplasma sp.]